MINSQNSQAALDDLIHYYQRFLSPKSELSTEKPILHFDMDNVLVDFPIRH